MINIIRQPEGLTVTGHAGFAPYGEDVVCAGVSALAQTLIGSLEELTGETFFYEVRPGYLNIQIRAWSEAGMLLVESFFLGIRMIADAYPDHVRIVQAAEDAVKAAGYGAGVDHL